MAIFPVWLPLAKISCTLRTGTEEQRKIQTVGNIGTAFGLLKSRGVGIDRARMDYGSFTKDVIKTVKANCRRFYIRAQR